MLIFRTKYAPGRCEYPPKFEEVRWDFSNCNLACQFCWSPASRPIETHDPHLQKSVKDVVRDTVKTIREPTNTFIRFTGGEPTLYWNDLSLILTSLNENVITNNVPVLIQTNGILIGNETARLDSLEHRLPRCLIELSFKGTNEKEFAILTGKPPELFQYQLNAYEKLLDLFQKDPNVQIIAVLGVYHSAVKSDAKYVFINPTSREPLFDNTTNWDQRFRAIWQSTKLKWVEPLRMSPKGVWDNLWKRCGPSGSGILKYFNPGISVNPNQIFPSKPKSSEYARKIVERKFWKV